MTEAVIVDTGKLVKIGDQTPLPVMYLRLGGVSLLRRQIEALRSAGFKAVFIITEESPGKIRCAVNWPAPLNKSSIHVEVLNPDDQIALNDLSARSPLIIPADMFFTADFVRFLKEGRVEKSSNKGRAIFLETEDDIKKAEAFIYQGLISPTDSFLTKKINRKISLAVTRRISNLPVHPNHITIFNFFLGVTGGLLFFNAGYVLPVVGAVLFLLSSILDGCDGELARLRYQKSRFGGLLDVVSDNIVHWVVFSGLTYRSAVALGIFPYGIFGLSLVLSSMAAFLLSLYATIWSCPEGGPSSVGLLFSESRLGDLAPGSDILDKMANRDFAYLLLFLSLLGHLEWFVILGGAGAPVFTFMLYRSLKVRGVM